MSSGSDASKGISLISLGVFLLFIGLVVKAFENSGSNSQFGGVILIGPFPVAFGSSPEITNTMMFIGAGIFILYMFLRRRGH
ncbi:uncharacterized protein (TIGR00304 family) [Methanohalophilus levihalophilus]|uniref:TIGR00304 family membrane protein n=1 Tax=Methanohalophilus levihalophilus TaxID=1431282 RepID=UPI001AE8DCC1|nr:DUF131 domain-containing protein [Methanohalophilus levihalophilus]MBP2030392.1 uncharacterized protein (TIGR00304 family) [Methanohalophilus levihalophilus]